MGHRFQKKGLKVVGKYAPQKHNSSSRMAFNLAGTAPKIIHPSQKQSKFGPKPSRKNPAGLRKICIRKEGDPRTGTIVHAKKRVGVNSFDNFAKKKAAP